MKETLKDKDLLHEIIIKKMENSQVDNGARHYPEDRLKAFIMGKDQKWLKILISDTSYLKY